MSQGTTEGDRICYPSLLQMLSGYRIALRCTLVPTEFSKEALLPA